MARAFEQAHPGTKVMLNFGASSALRMQLTEGARADVFASADRQNMDQAEHAGVIEGKPAIFATNRLAIVTRAGDSKVSSLADLARPGMKLVVAAPDVPIGAYFNAALERMKADPRYGPDFVARLRANVVSQALNVRQATSIVQLGEADATIAYETDARVANPPLRATALSEGLADPARYFIGVVRGAPAGPAAAEFADFVISKEGTAILQGFGFGAP